MADTDAEPRLSGLPIELLNSIACMLSRNDLLNFSQGAYKFDEVTKGPLYHTITVGPDGSVPLLVRTLLENPKLADTAQRLSITSIDHVLSTVKAQEPLTAFSMDQRFVFLGSCVKQIQSSVDVTQPHHLDLAERWMSVTYKREATSFVAVLLTLTRQVKELDLRMFHDRNQDAPSKDPLKSLFGGAIPCPCCSDDDDYDRTRFSFDYFNEYYHHDNGFEESQEAFDAALNIAYPPLKARKPLFPLSSRLGSVTCLSIEGTCIELLALGFDNLAILEVGVVRNPSTCFDIGSTAKRFLLPKLTTLVVRTNWKLHPTGVDRHRTAGHCSITKLLEQVDMPRIESVIIVLKHHKLIKPPGHLSRQYANSDRLLQCFKPLSGHLEELEIRVGNYNKAKLQQFRPISSIRNFSRLKKLSVPTQVLVPFYDNDPAAPPTPPCVATLLLGSLTSLTITCANARTFHWLQGLFHGEGLKQTNLSSLHLEGEENDDLSIWHCCLLTEDQHVLPSALDFYKEALCKLPVKFSTKTPEV